MIYIIGDYPIHRAQIYFEVGFFESIKKQAKTMNLSFSAYIHNTVKKDLDVHNKPPQAIDYYVDSTYL